MAPAAHWANPAIAEATQFVEGSSELAFRPGAGLVGTVWQSGEPLWKPDWPRGWKRSGRY